MDQKPEQAAQPATQPAAGDQAMSTEEQPKKMKWWMWLIIALAVIAGGVGAYLLIM
jgi:hypothetical protein